MTEFELQALWERIPLAHPTLITEQGTSVTIIRPGEINKGAGPDFKHAQVLINDVLWNGSIELHLNNSDWYAHGHHEQDQYDSVVLHLSYHSSQRPIFWKTRQIPSVSLKSYLTHIPSSAPPKALSAVPCYPIIRPIHAKALKIQQEKAAQEYFDRQVSSVMSKIPPGKLLEEGLRSAQEKTIWSLLGIPSNQELMEEAYETWVKSPKITFQELFTSHSLWDTKSPRPASSPQKRLQQAINVTEHIRKHPFPMPSSRLSELYGTLQEALKSSGIGTQTQLLLLRNALLPTWYIWALLTGQTHLRSLSYQQWQGVKAPAPGFLNEGFSFISTHEVYPNFRLDQYKTYCKLKRCGECLLQK